MEDHDVYELPAQPVVVLNDILSVGFASEVVIGEQQSDVDDAISITSTDSENSTLVPSTVTSVSSSRESSPALRTIDEIKSEIIQNNSKKRVRHDSEDEDDGKICPICLDNWTNSGEHRICSLKCGHLFGHNCIVRWLQSQSKKSCPTCKKKVMKNDIRYIYAKKLIAVDTSELEEIKEKLNDVIDERNKVQLELSKYICREHSLNQEINLLKSQLNTYKNNPLLFSTSSNINSSSQSVSKIKLFMDKSLDICQFGGCRVFDTNPGLDLIMASVKSPNNLFAGFGLRKISISQYKPLAFLPLHSGQIRDVCFQNTTVLTVSVDKFFKITDSVSNTNICSLQQSIPLWCCCWDSLNKNCFYIGTQTGAISKFDLRNLGQPLNVLAVPCDMSPVVSVAHVPNEVGGLPRDGIVSCKLNSLWFFENNSSEYTRHTLAMDGPFYSMKFDPISKLILVSSRPNTRHPNARHTLAHFKFDEDKINTNIVHVFESNGLQKHMSRSCFIRGQKEYIAAHEESSKVVNLWNINNGLKETFVPAHDAVLDLNSITTVTNNLLVALTEKKMLFYKFV